MSAVLKSLPSHTSRTAEGVFAQVDALCGPATCAGSRNRMSPPHASRQPARADRNRGLPARYAHRRRRLRGKRGPRRRSPRADLAGLPVHGLDVHDHVDVEYYSGRFLADEAADEIYATPDLRITTTIAPTSGGSCPRWLSRHRSVGVEYRRRPQQLVRRRLRRARRRGLRAAIVLLPTTEVEHQDNRAQPGWQARPRTSQRLTTCSSPRLAPSLSKTLPRATIRHGIIRICATSTGRL